MKRYTLVTGSTGFLGQFLLRDLIADGRPTAVLVRATSTSSAHDRVAELVATWSERLGVHLPMPVVLAGDVTAADCGLDSAEDRTWLSRCCRRVLHAAADLTFLENDGEPWHTNVAGTRTLLDVARRAGIDEWHHISTAFVCGKRTGLISENDELDCSVAFNNEYEESKCAAELELRRARGLGLNVYRPTVILGDSETGFTASYTGLYRLLELASRLADVEVATGRAPQRPKRSLEFRLAFCGDESFNLVTVDWVSKAIVSLCAAGTAGRTFHLTANRPIRSREVAEVAAQELGLAGATFAGDAKDAHLSALDQRFAEGAREYWPYLAGMPTFDSRNVAAALPHLPPPAVDSDLLRRLIRFAVSRNWGRPERRHGRRPPQARDFDCSHYVEHVFPCQARKSSLAHEVGLDITVGIDVVGTGGGLWTLGWRRGELTGVRRGLDPASPVVFRTDSATFWDLVQNRITPHRAFFDQKVSILGDIEMGLKLATLLGRFLEEQPAPVRDKEKPHAAA